MKDQCRDKVVVPALYEGKNCLYSDRWFHKWKYDPVERPEFAGPVDAGCFHQFQWKVAFHILFHIEKSYRCGDAWNDQRDKGIIHM